MAQVTLIDFWAAWCGPCKMMAPIIKEIEEELKGQVVVKEINVDEDQATASKYNVLGIPTYVIEKDGQEVGRKVGVTSKADLLKLIAA